MREVLSGPPYCTTSESATHIAVYGNGISSGVQTFNLLNIVQSPSILNLSEI